MAKKKQADIEIAKALVDNFINLQKVMTNMAIKFDNLSDNISRLLQLFEISAKTFIGKSSTMPETTQKDKEFLDKIDKLLEQNKTIAKGLTLMEEKIRDRVYGNRPEMQQMKPEYSPTQMVPSEMQGIQPNRFKKLPLV